MKKIVFTALVSMALNSGAQTSQSPGAASATAAATSPTQACNRIVEAAKSNNFDQVAGLMAMPDHKKEKMDKKTRAKFDSMHSEYMSDIQKMTCGDEQVAGDRAMVTAQTDQEKRLIPFIQKEGQWKFDMKTYRAFYMDEKKGKKSKSM